MTVAPPAAADTNDGKAVRCEVHDGTVTVEADGAGIPEIVESLASTLGFELSGDVPNGDLRSSKTLVGRPEELLAKLLQGSNYVLSTEQGALKRVTILPAQANGSMSVEQLRQKEGELASQIAQYQEFVQEALDRSRPELAKKFEGQLKELSREAEAVRARLAH
jgi:hypothetical protein